MGTRTALLAAAVCLESALPSAALGQTPQDFAAIGRQIAQSWDRTNGLPVESRLEPTCPSPRPCPPESLVGAKEPVAAIAQGLAEYFDVPLGPIDAGPMGCPWRSETPNERLGLFARFGIVSAAPDSVRVLVTSGCSRSRGPAPNAFRQAFVYELRRSERGLWSVVDVELRFIT